MAGARWPRCCGCGLCGRQLSSRLAGVTAWLLYVGQVGYPGVLGYAMQDSLDTPLFYSRHRLGSNLECLFAGLVRRVVKPGTTCTHTLGRAVDGLLACTGLCSCVLH